MKRRIMVTGASGFLGKTLVNRLLQNNEAEVMAVCHFSESRKAFQEHHRLVTRTADLENPDRFLPFFSQWKPEIVFHLGALARLPAGQKNPQKAVTVNLLGSMELLELSAHFGVKKFLVTSSDLARDSKSVVGLTKLLMEHYLQLFPGTKPKVVAFRMPNLYDLPGSVMDIFARQIAEGQDLSITDKRMARRFLTREEAVDYLLFLAENGESRQVYSVKQEPIRIMDIARKMITASGKNLNLRIIGARPGEKFYQASYSDEEAESMRFNNLARLQLTPTALEEIFSEIQRLPVATSLKATLQNKFKSVVIRYTASIVKTEK